MPQKYSLEFVLEKAKEKKYSIEIMGEYQNTHSKAMVTCENNHKWKTSIKKIISRRKCYRCYVETMKTDFHSISKDIEAKEAKLLNIKFETGKRTRLFIQCKNGHKFNQAMNDFRAGYWCPECAGCKKHTLQDVKDYIVKFEGELLSAEYKNIDDKLIFKCKYNHVFEKSFKSIKKNIWCSLCKINKSEEICRFYFEKIFNKQFPRVRPDFLLSNKGRNLELDGYCEDLGIAFEHNGIFHFKSVRGSQLNKTIDRDTIKQKLCKKHGVKLITIPMLFEKTKLENLQSFIFKECKKLNIEIPEKIKNIKININEMVMPKPLNDIHNAEEIAIAKGGKCLSQSMVTRKEKLKWQCKNNHIWEAPFDRIIAGAWCKACHSIEQKLTIEEIFERYKNNKEVTLLSTTYNKYSEDLNWRCNYCIKEFARPLKKMGYRIWECPDKCNKPKKIKVKKTVVKQRAQTKNKRTLTTKNFIDRSSTIHKNKYDYSQVVYENNRTKVKITCPVHGMFEQIPNSHLLGKGCAKCSNNVKMTLNEFIIRANDFHKNKYDYSKVTKLNSSEKIEIICPDHGNFLQSHYQHLKTGCEKCGADKKKTPLPDFISKANKIHNNKYNYSLVKYKNSYTNIIITCPLHGEFQQTPNSHLSGSGCRSCGYVIRKINKSPA